MSIRIQTTSKPQMLSKAATARKSLTVFTQIMMMSSIRSNKCNQYRVPLAVIIRIIKEEKPAGTLTTVLQRWVEGFGSMSERCVYRLVSSHDRLNTYIGAASAAGQSSARSQPKQDDVIGHAVEYILALNQG